MDREVLVLILCPQREQSSPLITPAPQNSLLDPESLSWHLASTLAAAVLARLPLERTSIWRFGPTHSSILISGPAATAELGYGLDGLC